MYSRPRCLTNKRTSKRISVALCMLMALAPSAPINAQDTVTGAFQGQVTDSRTTSPVGNATVRFINQVSRVPLVKRTGADGQFYAGLLQPGQYTIEVSASGYKPLAFEQRLVATRQNTVQPLPVRLEPALVAQAPEAPRPETPQPAAPTPAPPDPKPAPTPIKPITDRVDIVGEISSTDGRRGGAFSEEEVATLPLGGATFTRSFDELALLLPGVALPPQTQGGVAGPGVGPGVGSAGQFAINGLRSRANNFTVDGSDNNDEDIGVRRQGFFALVPQPIETIREYQIITHLAPAQFGRNLGAQVNAVSKSGGDSFHGTLYGFLNTSHLNAREVFDTANGSAVTSLKSGNRDVIAGSNFAFVGPNLPDPDNPRFLQGQFIPTDGAPITVRNESGEKDSLTFGQIGAAFGGRFPRFGEGGPVTYSNAFYFISAERQIQNASREANFAVPTVAERGAFNTGSTGIVSDPFGASPCSAQNRASCRRLYPTTGDGDLIFSLFPFPNNPRGVYGDNTFTRALPAWARGSVVSGKVDGNFKINERQQNITARYNFTDDERVLPVTGGAIFSSLRPEVRTQNVSVYLNSDLSGPLSTIPVFNQVRISYGRTRLNFKEERDRIYQSPSIDFPNTPFLLNRQLLVNSTLPPTTGSPNPGSVYYSLPLAATGRPLTVEEFLGPVGQVVIAGFSPVGVDVFNFPQRRVNNTYQIADTLSLRVAGHSIALGADIRRTELNSELPRNARPLFTFNGAPRLTSSPPAFLRPVELAAAGAASGIFLTLAQSDAAINLRYYQHNFFAQDEWRPARRPNLSFTYGLRYEYNSPPREQNRRIENTFNSSQLSQVPGLSRFIDGRSRIYDADRNNFAPRFGFAYSPELLGVGRKTVFRAGYGLFYDQILGAVVSQSRNVFPTFITLNTAGGAINVASRDRFELFNPANSNVICEDNGPKIPYVKPGTVNQLNAPLACVIGVNNQRRGGYGVTLPARDLDTPKAHHYSFSVEQQLGLNMAASIAYVGTLGRNLLRFTTPNLGPNVILDPRTLVVAPDNFVPIFTGNTLSPGYGPGRDPSRNYRPAAIDGATGVGAVNLFVTDAESRYDSLQLQLRGRLRQAAQYQVNYTFSKVTDDVSDVFDLAGAPALPQNSFSFAGEKAPANFDARHRVSYTFIYGLPSFANYGGAVRTLLGGLQLASIGHFQTGQPFTVNTIFDINLDGNLTDRLNTSAGITETGLRRQPLRVTGDTSGFLARPGADGQVSRNTFRAAYFLLANLAVIKDFTFNEEQRVTFRAEFFNFPNFANYGIPVRYLEAPAFGQATDTTTPGRRIQFALKYAF